MRRPCRRDAGGTSPWTIPLDKLEKGIDDIEIKSGFLQKWSICGGADSFTISLKPRAVTTIDDHMHSSSTKSEVTVPYLGITKIRIDAFDRLRRRGGAISPFSQRASPSRGDGNRLSPGEVVRELPLRRGPSAYPRDHRGKLTRWRHRNLHVRLRR
jgi:hypothetical protein